MVRPTGLLFALLLCACAAAQSRPEASPVERRVQDLAAGLGDDDPGTRDAAEAQIEKLDEAALPFVEAAAAAATDPEVQARLLSVAGRVRRAARMRSLADVWFRREDGLAWRRLRTTRGNRNGADAWNLEDQIVVRSGDELSEETCEAWTGTDGTFTILEATWKGKGTLPADLGKGRLELSVTLAGDVLVPRLRRFDVPDPDAALGHLARHMKDSALEGASRPRTWFRALPRIAVLLPPDTCPDEEIDRLTLPIHEERCRRTRVVWHPEERIAWGGEEVAVRPLTFHPAPLPGEGEDSFEFHMDDAFWLDAKGRILRYRERGKMWELSVEAEARKGVDR